MGWFDGWFGSDNSSSGSDPLRRLDPKLREFLERESPVKFNTNSTDTQTPHQSAPPPPPPISSQQQQQQQQQQSQQSPPDQQNQQQAPAVPAQSLFPDGRYAHLWKTYRPLAEIEAETKSDSEKLSDVLAAFKDRRGMIGRAALENCAEEQVEWSACMRSGSWRARATLCRDEVHRFERCYNAQSRLLKALGYLGVHGRSPEVDEDIQMRADELYHRMLAQEREVDRARAEGREVPALRPLFDDVGEKEKGAAGAKDDGLPEPGPATLASWKEKLEKLPPEEREAEEKALRAEFQSKVELARHVQGLWEEQARERKKRREEGNARFFDRFADLAAAWRGTKSD